jgi:hypothetical protein
MPVLVLFSQNLSYIEKKIIYSPFGWRITKTTEKAFKLILGTDYACSLQTCNMSIKYGPMWYRFSGTIPELITGM